MSYLRVGGNCVTQSKSIKETKPQTIPEEPNQTYQESAGNIGIWFTPTEESPAQFFDRLMKDSIGKDGSTVKVLNRQQGQVNKNPAEYVTLLHSKDGSDLNVTHALTKIGPNIYMLSLTSTPDRHELLRPTFDIVTSSFEVKK